MTDPGAGIRIDSVKVQPPELKTLCTEVSDAWHKSHSVVNMVNPNVPCNGDATTSSTSSSESLEPKNDGRIEQQNGDSSLQAIDQKLLCYIQAKEVFKERLYNVGFRGYVYSDLARVSGRRPLFSKATASAVDARGSSKLHLIVFVHGLEGTAEDLAVYRNYLRVTMPDANLEFLLSEANQTETWSDLGRLAKNLAEEILAYIQRMSRPPELISMVAHSMGGLIVRAACALDEMKPWVPKLYTLLTLNSPHCGLMYNQRAANWGITLLQWWKQSAAIGQLTLKDAVQFQDCFLYKLSKNNVFGYFRHVLLVGSYNDLYVPGHSALVDQCKAAVSDPSAQGTVYSEILANINESIATSPKRTTLVKYTVSHPLGNVPRSQQVMGRAAHIAAVDDESFIDTLISVSVVKYFR
ncbi:hypothetical protein AAVH_03860 [Aphelenchoides avenae]|nr:hypothetical protein AAVH_03860 [Aphelenchus avenae]